MILKRLFKQNRYFIVFYSGVISNIQTMNGNVSITTYDGAMFNIKDFTDKMIKDHNLKSLVVSNFIEVSKKDFKDLYDND